MDPTKIRAIKIENDFPSVSFDAIPHHLDGEILGTKIHREYYGLCKPHRIILSRDGAVVYMWDREEETRKEYFFDRKKPARIYEGNQFCFLEYCSVGIKKNRVPSEGEVVDNLDLRTIRQYAKALERIIRQ